MKHLGQRTLVRAFSFEGVGIHTGAYARVTVHPAPEGAGRVFQLGMRRVPARAEYVVDTRRCTALGIDSARILTVEHLLSVLHGLSIDNALITVDGPEIPILDGSALPFVELIRKAGIDKQTAPARVLKLNQPVSWSEQGGRIVLIPDEEFQAVVNVDFADWPDGAATAAATIGEDHADVYAQQVAPARTFAFRREVEALLAAGLAKGGSLDNALIITPPDSFSTPLRLPAEWAAHKLLDLIGDFALLDARLLLRATAHRPGHRSNTQAAEKIRDLVAVL